MSKQTVVLGLSGGMDSLASAISLQKAGYKVVGRTLKLRNSDAGIQEAKALAQKLGIEFGVIDAQSSFETSIIKPYVEQYLQGQTPSPCVWCNNDIKIRLLFEEMKRIRADFFATGHYIQIKQHQNKHYIYKGVDTDKDQSYFLWNVQPDFLPYWLCPLGHQTKENARKELIDNKMGYIAHKKESTGVCFVDKKGYGAFLASHPLSKGKIHSGDIVDENGEIIGKHQGLAFYTIGQKKGLSLNTSEKHSVIGIDTQTNRLIVGNEQSLYRQHFTAKNYRFFNPKDLNSKQINVMVRGIGRNPQGYCQIALIDQQHIKVSLEHPAWALAPGQPIVFYENNRLLGGAYVI